MKRILMGLLLSLPFWTLAQPIPDNEAIRNAISNPASPYYYRPLLNRYLVGDTTLTQDDYHYLYYGYAFQSTYKPLNLVEAPDSVLLLFERKTNPRSEDFQRLIDYGRQVMRSEPFNLRTINLLIYAYGKMKDTLNERINYDRFQKIQETIVLSGNGLREESPFHILYFNDAIDFLLTRGSKYGRPMIISRSCEYIPLLVRERGVKGYYFDYSRIYWHEPDGFYDEKKRSSGLELKNMPSKRR